MESGLGTGCLTVKMFQYVIDIHLNLCYNYVGN